MNQYQTTYFNTIDFLTSNDASLNQPIQATVKSKRKSRFKKCDGCKKRRKRFEDDHKFCRICYISNKIFKPIGNKAIDDFIKSTQCNYFFDDGRIETVSYDQFKDIEFIAEGGFSKVYKATWIDGPIIMRRTMKMKEKYDRIANKQVVLKKLNNSKNISFKELNEV